MKLMFYFDEHDKDVWSGRTIDYDIWQVFTQIWGVTELAVINNTDLELNTAGRDNIEIFSNEEVFFSKNRTFIHLEHPKNSPKEMLSEHTFDSEAWYCMGPAQGWSHMYRGKTLGIEQIGSAELHAPFVASVLCYEYYKENLKWQ